MRAAYAAKITAMRYVTENRAMPRGRKPVGQHALSNAERQARHRTRRLTQPVAVTIRTRQPIDRRSRPRRWRDAVSELLALQAEYADWLSTLPDSLCDSPTAQALEAIVELDLLNTRRDRPAPRLRPRLDPMK